jgi:hypothetical protein
VDFLAHEAPAFDALLREHGYRLVEDRSDAAAFGSRYLLFGRGREWLRLVWDGREGAAWAEAAEGDGPTPASGWRDVEAVVAGRRARVDRGTSPERADALRRAVAAFVRR